ncbi:hypothetical protein [Salinisphaera dokdonensis]|uniref:hypothetical protein n=1 Tax=Salinisphaera dokdonensis TaxID=454598 RepID=UPI00333FFB6D
MTSIKRTFAAAALFIVCTNAIAASDQAVVRKLADVPLEVGQALITHYRDRCIAVLPTHVVSEAQSPSLRYVGTRSTKLGNLTDVVDLGDDLSLGFVTGGITQNCGHGLGSFSRAVDARLSQSTQGALRFVNGDGSLGFEPVVWLDDDRREFIRVKPTSPSSVLRKGMSGSLLMGDDNTPIGMLLSVSTRSGVGKVVRMDRLLERAELALSKTKSRTPEADANDLGHSSPNQSSAHSAKKVLTLVAWSAPAATPANQAENLVSDDIDLPPWLTATVHAPVTLDFRVQPGTTLRGIVLDASSVAADLRPSAAELILANNENMHYARSVWGGPLDFGEKNDVTLNFAPTRPRVVRLILHPSERSKISFKSIKVLR